MTDFYQPMDYIYFNITKYQGSQKRLDKAIRLYCHQHKSGWTLQIRGPMGLGFTGHKEGKTDLVASAMLTKKEMIALRDAIDLELNNGGR